MEYLIKVSAILVLFYLCYKLLLNRETFFESNRSFLLLGLVTAFVLPLITISKYVIIESTIIENSFSLDGVLQQSQTTTKENPIELTTILSYIYVVGVLFFLGRFLLQFSSLVILLINSTKQRVSSFIYVITKNIISPFSFFNWIVFNPNQFSNTELEQIITHEKVHAKQLHSIDILLAELICILLWFNPLVWFYKKDLRQNLEFIADKNVQATTNCKKSYQHLLLKTSVPNYQMALTNNFYNSSIKKRIVMLHKNKSHNRNQLKFLLILPALALFLMSFNIKEIATYKVTSNNIETTTPSLASDIEIIMITSNMSNGELKDISKKYDKQGVQLKFKSIKRNNAGEITSISISAKTENSKVNYNTNDDVGINPIKISIDLDNNKISIGDSSNDMHFTGSGNVSYAISNGKNKIHKSKKGNNVFVYSESEHKHEEEVEHDEEIEHEEVEHEHEKEVEHEIIEENGKIIIKRGGTIHELKKEHQNNDENVFIISSGQGVTYHIIKADTINANGKIFKLKGNIVIDSKDKSKSLFVTSGKDGELIELKKDGNEDGEMLFIRKDKDGNIVKEKIKGKGNSFTFESKDGKIFKSKSSSKGTSNIWISKDEDDETITKIGKNGGTLFVTSDSDDNSLIIIDGKEVKNKKLKDIDPDTIESVSILKGESAIKKYGKKAKDGVIEISLKKKKD